MAKVNWRLEERGLVISIPKLIFEGKGHRETDVLGMAICEDDSFFRRLSAWRV